MLDKSIFDSNLWTGRTTYSLVKIGGLFLQYNKIPIGFICANIELST